MLEEDKAEIRGWIKSQSLLGTCPFCVSGDKEKHRPFCLFDGHKKVIDSETFNPQMKEWIKGFKDGLSALRSRKNPIYLLGNLAGRAKKNLNQEVVVK